MNQLINEIKTIIEKVGGTWGIVLEDLSNQNRWVLNENELFYAASVIKLPIMAAVFNAFEQGKFGLEDTIVLKREDLVGGSGILQHLTPGTELTIIDIVTLMIIQSDNTATNILIDLVGVEFIQSTMQEIGMVESTFYNKLMTVPVKVTGRNMINAIDISTLLNKLVTGKVVSRFSCEQMIDIMKKQQLTDCLPGRLPYQDSNLIGLLPEWEIANKTGWIPGVRHDAAIFYVGDRTMTATVLSKEADDLASKAALAEIGEVIFSYLKGEKG